MTLPSLTLAPSSVLCSRLTTEARSWRRLVRCRVNSRNSGCGRAGTKLARSSPWRSKSASQTASCTSVLRRGMAFTCAALTSSRVKRSASQSPRASRSAVMVGKVRTSGWGRPPWVETSTQATTVALCTSSPQQRGWATSMRTPSVACLRASGRPLLTKDSGPRAPQACWGRQSVVPGGIRGQTASPGSWHQRATTLRHSSRRGASIAAPFSARGGRPAGRCGLLCKPQSHPRTYAREGFPAVGAPNPA